MGHIDKMLQRYLSDKGRFADLYNAVCFQGKQVINAKDLTEGSNQYTEGFEEGQNGQTEYLQRVRDIKMNLQKGGTLRILALENQSLVDYMMPFRCLQYDMLEYKKQLDILRKKNGREKSFSTTAEWLCGIKKTDRISPVYTICLYHGEETWDGPRCLKDMMDFGKDTDEMSRFFSDYSMQLYCVNEESDFSVFHTELKPLFMMLKFRHDKQGLWKLLQKNPVYQSLDAETAEVAAALLHAEDIWKKRERYQKDRNGEVTYDMCQALRELCEDARTEGLGLGLEQGLERGIQALIETCREFGIGQADTTLRIKQKFSLTGEEAAGYVCRYWKE